MKPKEKIPVAVLGATGMVGQNYIRLLGQHPWFEVVYVAASPRSAGKSYREAVAGRWLMDIDIPASVGDLIVGDANDVAAAGARCPLAFSAVSLDKAATRALETAYAAAGVGIVSNNSAHRLTEDVPVIIPEINAHHLDAIPQQRQNRGWDRGFIITKPNCSLQSYLPPVYALMQAGYPVASLIVTTLQAVSGAGYPGPASLDMIDNVVPYIPGEEEKTEHEPQKILGHFAESKFVHDNSLVVSAHCNRVAVTDGHTACVSLKFKDPVPSQDEILNIWRTFKAEPQTRNLPTAPHPPLIYHDAADRPQPRQDRDAGNGMAITLGRLRACPVLDYRFVALSHNTVRGAAGGAILSAELAVVKGYV